jgi:hypothetical protein
MWAVLMMPTVVASQDCSSGRFGPGGRPCPEPQIQYGVGVLVFVGVVALPLAALWWWAVMHRYRPGQRLLPRVWWLLTGWSVLGVGAIGALFVLADQPLAKGPSTGGDSIVMGALTWIVVVGALIWVLTRDRRWSSTPAHGRGSLERHRSGVQEEELEVVAGALGRQCRPWITAP